MKFNPKVTVFFISVIDKNVYMSEWKQPRNTSSCDGYEGAVLLRLPNAVSMSL